MKISWRKRGREIGVMTFIIIVVVVTVRFVFSQVHFML
jgi:hypothetical protein